MAIRRVGGCTFEECTAAAAALARLAAGARFDVAVLDREMPGTDVVALARAIVERGTHPGLSLVLVTAAGHHGLPDGLFAATLSKPSRPAVLRAALQRALAGSERSGRPTPVHTSQFGRGNLRILLAEDNKVNQRVGLLLLERLGYLADVAGDGQEVLDALDRAPYDVVLMDVGMPEMDGLEATRRIRARTDIAQPRIVAMTASAFVGDRDACRAAGMDDFVAKPVRREELVAALEQAGATQGTDAGPTTETPPRTVVIDPAVLADLLRGLGGRAPVAEAELISVFLGELPRIISRLRQGLEAGDRELLHRAAHTLKSSSANMGGQRLSDLCAALEERSRSSLPVGVSASTSEIIEECGRVQRELTRRRQQLPR